MNVIGVEDPVIERTVISFDEGQHGDFIRDCILSDDELMEHFKFRTTSTKDHKAKMNSRLEQKVNACIPAHQCILLKSIQDFLVRRRFKENKERGKLRDIQSTLNRTGNDNPVPRQLYAGLDTSMMLWLTLNEGVQLVDGLTPQDGRTTTESVRDLLRSIREAGPSLQHPPPPPQHQPHLQPQQQPQPQHPPPPPQHQPPPPHHQPHHPQHQPQPQLPLHQLLPQPYQPPLIQNIEANTIEYASPAFNIEGEVEITSGGFIATGRESRGGLPGTSGSKVKKRSSSKLKLNEVNQNLVKTISNGVTQSDYFEAILPATLRKLTAEAVYWETKTKRILNKENLAGSDDSDSGMLPSPIKKH